jgi:ArsR family transcriptional regulator, lead/cadmium/zinc/bismuth-responsive transcriptional repressor
MIRTGDSANLEVRCAGCNAYCSIETVKVYDNGYYCPNCYLKLQQGQHLQPGEVANRAVTDFYRSMAPPRHGPTRLRNADQVIECKYCGMVITRERLAEDESGKFCCPKCGTDLGIRYARHEIPGNEDYAGTALMFRRLGDPCRVKIIESLCERELNVSAFVDILGAQYSLTSYHLKVLKGLGLIKSCKQGNFVIYSLTDKGRAACEFMKIYTSPGPESP